MSAKGVTIQLDVPRKIRFDGEALLRLEEISGMTVLQICRRFGGDEGSDQRQKAEARAENFSFKLIGQIAQAGLTEEMPHATTADIIKLMDKNGKGDGTIQRIFSYTVPVFSALSEAIGADPKNVEAGLEKATTPGREEKQVKSVGTGEPTSV